MYAAAQGVDLARTEPGPQQRIQFQCRILLPSAALILDLPTGNSLEFGVLRKVGDVRNSSDNVYSTILTGNTEEDEHTQTDSCLPQLSLSYSLSIKQLLLVKVVLWRNQWNKTLQ